MGGTYTRRSTIFSQNGKNWIYSQTIGNLTTFQIPIDILKKVTHAFFKFLKIRDPAGSHYKHVLILQVNIGDGIP